MHVGADRAATQGRPAEPLPLEQLAALRAQIDTANDQILAALERRAELVLRVMKLKLEMGRPVVDKEREREMLQRLAARTRGPFCAEEVRRIFRVIIDASRGLARRCVD